jgi:hypothetical protein
MMTQSRNLIILILITIVILLAGCSSGDSPVSPVSHIAVGAGDLNPGGQGILGLYSINLDTENLTFDVTPLRNSSSTNVLESVDITNFLRIAPCKSCVKVKSVSFNPEGYPVLSIGIKHPFRVGDPFKPISGQNRADLHVFNVEGIVISNQAGIIYPGIGATVADFRLLSADGYTGYLDAQIDTFYSTEATIHPYVLHFDDYSSGNFNAANTMGFASVTDPPPSGNLVMAMGCDYNYQDYVFDVDGKISLIYAIGCTYGVAADTKNQRFTPEYRIPQHNKKAASEISVVIVNNQLMSGIVSSSADVKINVVDISHGVPAGTGLDQMLSESNVDDVYIDIPGILNSPDVINGSTGTGSGHSPSDPLVLSTTITNEGEALEGDYLGLVMVTDTYAPGQNTSVLLNGMDGISRVPPAENPLTGLFQIPGFVTYQAFSIHVGPGCGPIAGSILEPDCPVTNLSNGSYVSFTVEASSGNGGDPITLYEIDYNYDGSTFSADNSNDDGIFTGAGPFNVPDPCEDNIPHTFTVAFQATDSCIPPNVTVFAECDVTVDQCGPNFKNLPLRGQANDLAVTPQGDLLIVFEDGQVWKYYEASMFQQTAANYLFTAQVVQSTLYNPPPTPWLAKDFIDVADDGNMMLSHANGANCENPPVGNWPTQSFSATGTPLGSAGSHCTAGPVRDVYCYKSGSGGYNLDHVTIAPYSTTQSNMYRISHSGWWWAQNYGQDVHGMGPNMVIGDYVRGAESSGVATFWQLEGSPDFYCSEFIQDTFFYYHYNNKYFGTGSQTESDNGWNDPKDLTMDSRGNLYVLDQMNDGTGRVKGFTGSASGGTSLGHFDVPNQMSATPRRIEGSGVTGAYGNLIFILHGDASNGYFLSVILPGEIPW